MILSTNDYAADLAELEFLLVDGRLGGLNLVTLRFGTELVVPIEILEEDVLAGGDSSGFNGGFGILLVLGIKIGKSL